MLGYIISDKENINVEEHEIHSFDELHKTDLNIFVVKNNKVLYKNNIVFNACGFEHVKILDWFVKSGNKIVMEFSIYICDDVCDYFIDYASSFGHIKILKWFNSNYKFEYSKNSINYASCYGHVEILEWFKDSGYKFKYDKNAFMWASENNNVNILKFFVENISVKKTIKWSKYKFLKTIKYKTKNNYIKGYNKN
jgi:hypothetical protein